MRRNCVSGALKHANQTIGGNAAEVSCGFNGNELVYYVVHLYQPGADRAVFKVQPDCLQNVGTEFLPRLGLREDRVTQRMSAVAAFLRVPNLED